ncbi:beta-hydroxyacyl-ACP dehydratase [Myxococcota bacterium]|nr:beta-hydroxyacyl-ACP dehydratase [Myxococcota bacterium]
MSDVTAAPLPSPADVIPHRPPFLYLDRVLTCGADLIVGECTFAPDAPFFAGHFPGRPIVPGVILLEGLAQTLAYGVLLLAGGGRPVLLGGLDRVKFRHGVGPGDTVTYEIRPTRTLLGVTTANGIVRVGDAVAVSAIVKGYLGR